MVEDTTTGNVFEIVNVMTGKDSSQLFLMCPQAGSYSGNNTCVTRVNSNAGVGMLVPTGATWLVINGQNYFLSSSPSSFEQYGNVHPTSTNGLIYIDRQ